MLHNKGYESRTGLRRDLEIAMSFLGESSRDKLLYLLIHRFSISLGDGLCSSMGEIEAALRELLGEGTSIIMARLNNKPIDEDNNKTCKVCDGDIDFANTTKEAVFANLCDECWKMQNTIQWEIS